MNPIVNQSIWNILDQFSGILRSLVISVICARALTVSEFGVFTIAMSLRAISYSICTFGLDKTFIKLYSENGKSIIGSTFQLKLIFAVLSFSFCSFYIFYFIEFEYVSYKSYTLIILLSLLLSPFDYIDFLNKALKQHKINAEARIITFVFVVFTRLILFYNDGDFLLYALFIPLDYCVYYLVLIVKRRKFSTSYLFNKTDFGLKPLFYLSYSLGLAGILYILKSKVDVLILIKYLPSDLIGIYSVFINMYLLIQIGLTSLTTVSLPYILNKENISIKESLLTALSSSYILYSISVALFLYFFGEGLIEFLFGTKYLSSFILLKTSIVAFLLLAFGSIRTVYLVSIAKTEILWKIQIIVLFISILVLELFTQKYGIISGVYALVIGQFFSSIILNIFWKETRNCLKIQFNSLNLAKFLKFIYDQNLINRRSQNN